MCVWTAGAKDVCGRVVDERHQPILYATVYIKDNPIIGTATNPDGVFHLEIEDKDLAHAELIFSCVGYSVECRAASLLAEAEDIPTIMLVEQPIALEETVVSARKTKMSKRKVLAQVLHEIYARLEQEWPQSPVRYQVVSDVKMDAASSPWGMEQLIATAIELPAGSVATKDSLQFRGDYCKRYCDPSVRERADSLLKHESNAKMLKLATAIDSGTVVHRSLWKMCLDRGHLLDTSDELARWKLSREDDGSCVVTYTRKYNYVGVVKIQQVEHLIVDSYDFSLKSYTVDLQVQLFLPFSIKLKDSELEWVNLLNMSGQTLEKFRLKRGTMSSRMSTLYVRENGVLVPSEKNMHTTALLQDLKGNQLPCEVWATQHVTNVTTAGVHPFPHYSKSRKVSREIVPIY